MRSTFASSTGRSSAWPSFLGVLSATRSAAATSILLVLSTISDLAISNALSIVMLTDIGISIWRSAVAVLGVATGLGLGVGRGLGAGDPITVIDICRSESSRDSLPSLLSTTPAPVSRVLGCASSSAVSGTGGCTAAADSIGFALFGAGAAAPTTIEISASVPISDAL